MTALATSLLCFLLLLVPAVADIGTVLAARADAQSAADAASLAAMQEYLLEGDVNQAASEFALKNGCSVSGVSIGDRYVIVTVSKRPSLLFAGKLGIQAPLAEAQGKAELKEGVADVL